MLTPARMLTTKTNDGKLVLCVNLMFVNMGAAVRNRNTTFGEYLHSHTHIHVPIGTWHAFVCQTGNTTNHNRSTKKFAQKRTSSEKRRFEINR